MKITCSDHYDQLHTFEEEEFVERPAVYGVLMRDNNILLVKDAWGKKWGLPGGGIDEGENEREALIREFKEETNIDIAETMEEIISDVSYFLAVDQKHPWKTLRKIYKVKSLTDAIKEDGNNMDVIEAKFISKDIISSLQLQTNMQQVFEKLFK